LRPLAPCVTVKLLGEAESVKLGAGDRVYGEGHGGAVRQATRGAGMVTVAAPAVAVLLAVSGQGAGGSGRVGTERGGHAVG